MAEIDTQLPCALLPTREAAEQAAAQLRTAGLEVEIGAPGSRFHGLAPGTWEIRVPAGQAARARVLLGE